MVDDVFFDLLHHEMVNVFTGVPCNEASAEMNVSKLEQIGFMTGYRLSEKATKDCQRFKDELDVMKFICKEFWSSLFKKQIDNLRTNHQGVYVLLDNKFRFLTQITTSKQYMEILPKYLAFTCGLIRGALSNLGVVSVVTGEVVQSPSCRFQVQVQRS
ncbi:trafficking protein particle complex subunit 6B-like protein [Leptotrombidium deliense]|uniref:Trafficking protein particle complex subunit 6B n=1 Tax=Leptotrombidium deliense TaxID=299467 RepID=A0A443SML6_9ACAR|nr:trafficking protein particle complex subunit 6B-like protein [Leptotrombidium deliense]